MDCFQGNDADFSSEKILLERDVVGGMKRNKKDKYEKRDKEVKRSAHIFPTQLY